LCNLKIQVQSPTGDKMAAIKIGYIGGGSTRAPGTIASWIAQGQNFSGSEIVLIDIDADRLEIVKMLGEKMARAAGIDMRFSATTDRRAGLADCDAVLSSYRAGGFEARWLDESIPLKHGVIGQETQGPGGFFMALRSIHVMKDIIADMETVCPRARLFNYTNPVNIVAEAVTHNSFIPTVSLCEGPLVFPAMVAKAAGLSVEGLDTEMMGLNHGSWSIRHLHDGEDLIKKVEAAYEERRHDPSLPEDAKRLMAITIAERSIPAQYFKYYYYRDEIVDELKSSLTTRSQDIMAKLPDYWQHYAEQAKSDNPFIEPARSRGGIHEMEIAIDVMDALYNDRGETWPVNVPNNGAIADLPDDRVVEVTGYVDRNGIRPLASGKLPPQVTGLVHMLGEYQAMTAKAAWDGDRRQAVQALASNPLVLSLSKAEALYNDMAAAHRAYLPERLLA
jgi:6-phospho-beta-glucosidase